MNFPTKKVNVLSHFKPRILKTKVLRTEGDICVFCHNRNSWWVIKRNENGYCLEIDTNLADWCTPNIKGCPHIECAILRVLKLDTVGNVNCPPTIEQIGEQLDFFSTNFEFQDQDKYDYALKQLTETWSN